MYTLYIILYFSTDCCHYTLHFASDLLEESDLDLLTQELRPAQHKWESIGCELLYSADDIHHQYSDDGDRLREMLRKQLQYFSATTWRNIVDSLRCPGIRESQLADQLEAKYCPSEFTNQWRSQSAADARAQHGHTTFASSLVPRPRPAFSRLQYGNAEATRKVSIPQKILEFVSFLARSGATLGHTIALNWSTLAMHSLRTCARCVRSL